MVRTPNFSDSTGTINLEGTLTSAMIVRIAADSIKGSPFITARGIK